MQYDYKQIFKGSSLMVIVPHEDDEINLAGAVIRGAAESGMDVTCVFLTNGDWFYPPEVRLNEAIQALRALGVQEDHIVFLGYRDGGVHAECSSYRKRSALMGGHVQTRGLENHPEFAFQEYGIHHDCVREALLQDMEDVIRTYRPDAIIATDWDHHPDHKMCSLVFDTAMGRILRERDNTYHPVVLKGFAYNTTYNGVDDFSSPNLLSAKMNRDNLWNQDIETDDPCYRWEGRIRVPLRASCREQVLTKNPLYKAMCCHVSQGMMRRARRIINADQVFWQRRTDNLALRGVMTASSGEADFLHDFKLFHAEDLSTQPTRMEGYVWCPAAGDREAWCRCTFAEEQTIGEIVFHGNAAKNERILEGELSFSNGQKFLTGPFHPWGMPTVVRFPIQEKIKWVQFRILKRETGNAGISEWEIFSDSTCRLRIFKILVNDNFAYTWYVKRGETAEVNLYSTGPQKDIRWYWNGNPCPLDAIRQNVRTVRSGVIRAELADDPSIYDEVQVKPWNQWEAIKYQWRRLKNWAALKYEKKRERTAYHRAKKAGQLFSAARNDE